MSFYFEKYVGTMAAEIKSVRVAYADFPPFVEVIPGKDESELGGFMPEIVRSLAQSMNLKVEWIREPEDRYGTWENNTWTGLCGMLFRNEVDLIVNPLLPSADYAAVVFFTNPVIYEAFTILSGKQKMDGGFFLYFSVLEPMVWAFLGLSLVVIALVSALLYLGVFGTFNNWVTAIAEYFWVYIAYTLRQVPGEKWMFLNVKRRTFLSPVMPMLIMLWVIGVSFLIMTVFQSLLVSKLAIIRSQPTVDSMPEFLKKENVIGRAPLEIELHEVLKDSGIQVYEDTWKKLEPKLVDIDTLFNDEAYKGLEEGSVCIFHGYLILKSVLSNYFVEHGNCNFHLSNNKFFPFPLLMALQKNLPKEFLQKFNYGMTRLVDADISGKIFKPIDKTSDLCTSYSDSTLKPLNLKNILGVLMIWAVGMSLSIISFIAERMSSPNKMLSAERYSSKKLLSVY